VSPICIATTTQLGDETPMSIDISQTYQTLFEINIRAVKATILSDDVLFERALSAGMMSLLLEQEGSYKFTDEDSNKLQAAVSQAKQAVDSAFQSLPGKKEKLKDIFTTQLGGLPDPATIGAALASGDTKKIKDSQRAVQKLSADINRTFAGLSSVNNVLIFLGNNLKPVFDKLAASQKGASLTQLVSQVKGGKLRDQKNAEVPFPDLEGLKKVIQNNYEPTKTLKSAIQSGVEAFEAAGGGGFLGKIKGFIKGVFGGEGTGTDQAARQALYEYVMSLKPNELMAAATAAQQSEAAAAPAAKEAATSTTPAVSAAVAAGESNQSARAAPRKRLKASDLKKMEADVLKTAVNQAHRDDGGKGEIVERAGRLHARGVILSERWETLAGLKGKGRQ
jgi:hypothetical protein